MAPRMSPIQPLYAQNIISRLHSQPRQHLRFAILVKNQAYEKEISVRWAGEDGIWQRLPAAYAYTVREGEEVWRAQTTIAANESQSLPGNIQFALQCRMSGQTHWDNGNGRNLTIEADAGIRVNPIYPVLNLEPETRLPANKQFFPLTIAVDKRLNARRVFVRWSTDGWRSHKETPCAAYHLHWDSQWQSNARNANQYGTEIWTGRIHLPKAYRLQYAIGVETDQGIVWDNNRGVNYTASHPRLTVLTLNLHCYQEAAQAAKFDTIAKAIVEQDVDVVCLQEVCEPWNGGHGDWTRNAANLINSRLPVPYHIHTGWSHIGFDRFREGLAILSRYPLLKTDAGYISHSQDPYDIHARQAVMAQVKVPFIGRINVFSAHLSWWDDGFPEQFKRLRRWANETHRKHVKATLLCGDFNVKAYAQGYARVVAAGDFEDQYLKTTNRAAFDRIYRQQAANWQDDLRHDQRIDYIFQKKHSALKAVEARELFNGHDYGRVSDHTGYLVTFEPYD